MVGQEQIVRGSGEPLDRDRDRGRHEIEGHDLCVRVRNRCARRAALVHEHLRVLSQRNNIEIRVLPWSVGAHAAMAGAFRILDFDDPEDPDVVYLESHVGALYLEEPAEVDEYRRIFDLIRKDAIPVQEYRG